MKERAPERRYLARLLTFLVLFVAFFLAAANLEKLTLAFGRSQSENYAALAHEALERKDFDQALQFVQRRVSKRFYDFKALYLLGEIYAQKGDFSQAVETMLTIFARLPGARANQVTAIGFDEPKTYYLLATYLWKAGQFERSAEMLRAALDAGYPVASEELGGLVTSSALTPDEAAAVARIAMKLRQPGPFLSAVDKLLSHRHRAPLGEILRAEWMQLIDKNFVGAEMRLRGACSLYPEVPPLKLALSNLYSRTKKKWPYENPFREGVKETTGVKVIGSGLFRKAPGIETGPTGLVMKRNGKTAATVSTGAFRISHLVINASGTWALGMYPVVVVRVDGIEVTRLYVDEPTPHLYDLLVWPQGAPKEVSIEFEFINDAYEPSSRADRNVIIHDVLLY